MKKTGDVVDCLLQITDIAVTRWGHGYQAHAKGQPGLFGNGMSRLQAVGDLMLTHRDKFNVPVKLVAR
jgi:hypothetical protein